MIGSRAREMSQWVEELAIKSGSLSLVPGTSIKVEGENQLHRIVL